MFLRVLAFLYRIVRPLLFRLDAELAHSVTFGLLKPVNRLLPAYPGSPSPVSVFGTELLHRVGVAGGLDKAGELGCVWAALGFSFAEFGTFTPGPQSGNPRPRLFRYPEELALINRMGFNNPGITTGCRNILRSVRPGFRYGISIGKQKETPADEALDDYLRMIDIINAASMDGLLYVAVNISSPNTPGLRALQSSAGLKKFVSAMCRRSAWPIVVKLAPDFDKAKEFSDAVNFAADAGAGGLIISNTSTSVRIAVSSEQGGVSGAPIRELARRRLDTAASILKGRIPLVASGGIMSAEDVRIRIDAGADLVQVYTGLVFAGPQLLLDIHRTGIRSGVR